ncbi:TetR/AcrR family transcriptional regulator [Mucisphaera calidilacus]|uniref:DNA-binding transcriptional regulator EnvR n=1 Tax=Mucisphaera calidilacus TaxID=2527982 RepID=A0A518BYS8_9BACT|nr:TetR/AcrR family transcriptional regulator [Mucisphaera calidilacus]QDU72127.1 DNA-binding transcriptional regulator EnvR [Mucisphaera calidilacus]
MVNDRLHETGDVHELGTRHALTEAALRLARDGGMDKASVRSITREAGVTEATLYRHFQNKSALWEEIYKTIVLEMIREKQELVDADQPFRQRLRRWVELTYNYYDGNVDAFTYVLLMPRAYAERLGDIYYVQGRLLRRLLADGMTEGNCEGMDLDLAVTMVTGLMLNVPRRINEEKLQGPALHYCDRVADAIFRVLGCDAPTDRDR